MKKSTDMLEHRLRALVPTDLSPKTLRIIRAECAAVSRAPAASREPAAMLLGRALPAFAAAALLAAALVVRFHREKPHPPPPAQHAADAGIEASQDEDTLSLERVLIGERDEGIVLIDGRPPARVVRRFFEDSCWSETPGKIECARIMPRQEVMLVSLDLN